MCVQCMCVGVHTRVCVGVLTRVCGCAHTCVGVWVSKISLRGCHPPQEVMDVVFNTWDMAGQEVYYATHQCFLSRNTLYLVVWNMEEGEKGVHHLQPWLLNIQVMGRSS